MVSDLFHAITMSYPNSASSASPRVQFTESLRVSWSVLSAVSQPGLVAKARRLAGKQAHSGSNPVWLTFLFKSCCLWTLSCDRLLPS